MQASNQRTREMTVSKKMTDNDHKYSMLEIGRAVVGRTYILVREWDVKRDAPLIPIFYYTIFRPNSQKPQNPKHPPTSLVIPLLRLSNGTHKYDQVQTQARRACRRIGIPGALREGGMPPSHRPWLRCETANRQRHPEVPLHEQQRQQQQQQPPRYHVPKWWASARCHQQQHPRSNHPIIPTRAFPCRRAKSMPSQRGMIPCKSSALRRPAWRPLPPFRVPRSLWPKILRRRLGVVVVVIVVVVVVPAITEITEIAIHSSLGAGHRRTPWPNQEGWYRRP